MTNINQNISIGTTLKIDKKLTKNGWVLWKRNGDEISEVKVVKAYEGGRDMVNIVVAEENNKKRLMVLFSGFFINMSLGVLYSWSIFSLNLTEELHWTKTSAALPYTVAIIMFATMMIPAGKLQDKFGGRKVATCGGILTGAGLILSSFFPTVGGVCFSFGVLSGSGIGMAYAAVTPSVVKWFPDNKKGLVMGVVVAGFGLSPVYMAPLTNWMINSFGIYSSFRTLGVGILILVVILSQFLFKPEHANAGEIKIEMINQGWKKIVKSKEFIMLWVMFLSGAMGGLMIIGHLSKIAAMQLGSNAGFILVALAAISNASGRPIFGVISDKIGRGRTMVLLALIQGTVFLVFAQLDTFALLMIGAAVVTFTYGGSFAVYPSAVSDYYGKENFGRNYGILFSAWGLGGVLGPLFAGKIVDSFGNYDVAYLIAAMLSLLSAGIGIKFYLNEIKSTEKRAI